jgi:hypothetical protein
MKFESSQLVFHLFVEKNSMKKTSILCKKKNYNKVEEHE